MLELIEDLGMQFTSEILKFPKRIGLYKCVCGKEFKTRIHWENGKKSLPMRKENSLIEIVEGEARIVSLEGSL